ncbi:MAG: 30S ribosomal protein S7 [Fimbriimonadaceae bacterium]|nr:30S ribosomal protein S7 [Fimbriimonadaceae bacterium]
MSRKHSIHHRETPPDPVLGSTVCERFIRYLMKGGKRSRSEHVFYGALLRIAERTGRNPLEVFEEAFLNVRPRIEVQSRRVGGSTYQIPAEVRPVRSVALTIRWIVGAARSRGEKGMIERLAAELIDASSRSGGAYERREQVFRMAEANKAYAHYRV